MKNEFYNNNYKLLEQEKDKISKTIYNTNNNNILFQQIQILKNEIDIFKR